MVVVSANLANVQIEGNLIAPDLTTQFLAGNVKGQGTQDFGLKSSEKLTDEIAIAWGDAKAYWSAFQRGLARLDESDAATTLTRDQWVLIKIRDHGGGVAPETLSKLTRPFFRGDTARTAATGAGLGLAIVEKTIHRMGGMFSLANTNSGGLAAHIKLRRS